jgi:endonuclease III
MAKIDRGALIGKSFKVLKKHYQPIEVAERPVLEQMLYGLCLENSPYDAAAKAFQVLQSGFFDWNEVRVSTVDELAEAMSMLAQPRHAAHNIKRLLYSVFESGYSFELESLKKMNVGAAIQKLEKYQGSTPFSIALVTQTCLGGHSIPLDAGALLLFKSLGLASDADVAKATVPGLERAIPKNKGLEYGSLLHQFAAELHASPYSTNLHKIILEISPEAKETLPKRPPKTPPVVAAPPSKGAVKGAASKVEAKSADGKSAKAPAKPDLKSRPADKSREPEKKPSATVRPAVKAEPVKRPPAEKKVDKSAVKKKPSEHLSKRKPR